MSDPGTSLLTRSILYSNKVDHARLLLSTSGRFSDANKLMNFHFVVDVRKEWKCTLYSNFNTLRLLSR